MFGRSTAASFLGLAGLALAFIQGCGGSGTTDPTVKRGARILTFHAEPARIEAGQEATLVWETENTSGVAIEPQVGLQPPAGMASVRPFATTTYTLTIQSDTGELTSQVTIDVSGGPPRIDAFTARPRTISPGEASKLEWTCSNADSVSIEPGLGTVQGSGSADVRPEVTTTYRLTASGNNQSVASEVTIVVASGGQPLIRSFTAAPQTISAGQTVRLAWEVSLATMVTISNVPGTHPAMGSVMVMPSQTTAYTLTAVGPGGSASASVMVQVNLTGDPTVTSFKATPSTIAPGSMTELAWETDNATSVSIDNGVGTQPAKGQVMVSPRQTTTYTLTAFGNGKEVRETTTVTVAGMDMPVIDSFTVMPQAVTAGGSTTLSWRTQNATSVDIDNGVGNGLMASGSAQVTPQQTTTYTLTARGARGNVTAMATVTVNAAPPAVGSFTAQPASINAGGMTTLSWMTTGATSVEIDNGVGSKPASGTVSVSPSATTMYTLTAIGPGGRATATVNVTVTAVGAPVVDAFTAMPTQVVPGAATTLSWRTTGATMVSIDNGIGVQPAMGSTSVSPGATTTYTLSASGPGGTTTAQVTVTVASPNGDQCASAFVVSGSGTFTGNTQTAVNDYSQSNACTNFPAAGPDVVYKLTLQAGDRVRATLQPGTPTWDASLYMVTSCADVATSCVAGQDNGNPEEIDYTAAAAGDYFLIVDGFASASGPYTLTIDMNPAPIANDTCQGAIDATMGGTFMGNTATARADYSPPMGGCTNVPETSKDLAYRVSLRAGERLQASVTATWDASLYVVTDCANVTGTCVAGQDDGNPESIDYTASAAGNYFLIVDGYGSGSGAFTLTVNISPPVIGGDTCMAAVPIPAVGGSFQSTTTGLMNNYEPAVSCTGYEQHGPDRVYSTALAAGDVVELDAEFQPSLDGSVYVVTDCASLMSCVAGADRGIEGENESLRFVARQAGTHYIVVDAAASTWSGDHDLTVVRYGGDTCADAPPLRLDNQPEWFTTTGKQNNYSPNSGGCTGYTATGEDRAYTVRLRPGEQLQATVTPSAGFDASVYLVSSCADVSGSCVQGQDATTAGPETIAAVSQTLGTYYLIVDGYNGTDGSGTITATIARGEGCRDAYRVPPTGGVFRGTTTGYRNDLGTSAFSTSCTNFSQLGADAVYRVTLDPGKRLTASLNTSWDAALYLVSDCAQSATTCVTGQDNGNPEDLTYVNMTTTSRAYYLVVDAWTAGATYQGNYTLTVTIQ